MVDVPLTHHQCITASTALLYAFLAGAVLPIPFYLMYKRYPK